MEISMVLNRYLERLPFLTFITKMQIIFKTNIKYLQFFNTTKILKSY